MSIRLPRTSGEVDGPGTQEPQPGCIGPLSNRYLDSGCRATIFALSPAYREAGENTKSCTEMGRLPIRSKCTTRKAFAQACQRSNWTVSRKERQRLLCLTTGAHTASASFSAAPQREEGSSPHLVESEQLSRDKPEGTRRCLRPLVPSMAQFLAPSPTQTLARRIRHVQY